LEQKLSPQLKKKIIGKKGFYYSLDALFGSLLLIGAIILILNNPFYEKSTEQRSFFSQDGMNVLSELKLNEVNSTFIKEGITNGTLEGNRSVIEQIGEYWALNENTLAQSLFESAFNISLIGKKEVILAIGDETIYASDTIGSQDIVVSRRMIAGIMKGSPITGTSASAYLRKVRDKKTSTYSYFGGFTGQGNITKVLDLNNVNVIKIILEIDVATDGVFQLKINGNTCNSSPGISTFTPSTANMTSDYWDISSCNSSLITGQNNFTFLFDDLNNAYISGGYIKIDYKTDEFQDSSYSNYAITHLPGINGAVNIYDSFYVPGELNNLNIYLHYKINTTTTQNTFFMTLGNTTIFLDNYTNGETFKNLTDVNLSMLNYEDFNSSTIPLRLGFENITLQSVIISSGEGFGDIVVTTDVSGSMAWEFDSSNSGITRLCTDPLLYDSTTSRISVAKCVDKIFVDEVLLNTTLNRIGLVSYATNTARKFNLTNDQDSLESEINTYSASGSTCIACGITDAYNLLSTMSTPQLHKDLWKYDLTHQFTAPDATWYTLNYDDSSWIEGKTSFGYRVSGVNTVLSTNNVSANLWEYFPGDTIGAPNDFSSGKLNITGYTYGLNITGNDGWDNKTGTYGGNGTGITIVGLSAYTGNYKLRINADGQSSKHTSDGSYGIQFNVTDEMRNIILAGGYATTSFEYRWVDYSSNNFESTDEVWIKARLTNTSGNSAYLGSQLDSAHSGADSTFEIYAGDNPNNDFSGTFSTDITSNITTTGYYYLDLGGKITRDATNEDGRFYFDNIQVTFVNAIGNTYYRNNFSMNNLTRFSDAKLYIASDNNTQVYLNGNLIDDDATNHAYSYWNRIIDVPINKFVEGNNVIAVKLNNNDSVSGFLDIELRANMTGRQSAILVMSDGDANQCVKAWDGVGNSAYCNDCSGRSCCPNSTTGVFNVMCPDIPNLGGSSDGTETAFEQVVNISCYLHTKYNISMYSVAFGTASSINGTKTLNLSAACDDPTHFYTTTNVSAIAQIYQDIASSIVTGFSSRESQAIIFSGGSFASSTLYPDSYISYNYTSIITPPNPGEIELTFESPKFTTCNQTITIPEEVRIIDAKITSYSGPHWTDYLSVNGVEVFNLSKYNSVYLKLGDPFIIQIPIEYLNHSGSYNISLKTGDDPTSNTNCSSNNSFIYTALIPSAISRSDILPNVVGCEWIVESEGNENTTIKIPPTYVTGTKPTCYYTNSTQTYNPTSVFTDAYDLAVYTIFKQLDVDNDGRIIVLLEAEDLEVVVLTVGGLPYMWGPTVAKFEVWP